MIGGWRSLRLRVAVLGFVAIYAPVLLLFGVGLAAEEESVAIVDGVEVTVTAGGDPSGWTLLTLVLLAPVAVAAAWWLSGRAVVPLDRVRRAAEDIEATDPSRRIALDRGPTEVVALAGAFDAVLDRLETAADVQRTLIEEVSHELRTPLAVVLTSAEVALDAPTPSMEDHRVALERTRAAGRRMRRSVDALLVEARGRARVLDRRSEDVAGLVGEVAAEIGPVAAARDVVVDVEVMGDAEATIDGDALRRAVADLVANAVRHSPTGGRVAVGVDGSAAGIVTVAVTDHGPGVSPQDQGRVFERFWRGDGAEPGIGLGLAIARQVARAHGGDVSLRSPGAAGDGCTFTLTVRR